MASEQDSAGNGNVETLAGRKILILYGSETGNSEDAAGDIERMARRLHFQTLLEEMDDVGLVSSKTNTNALATPALL
jgi:sulfite reductase alpha subunit-like flavoprotein